MHTATPPASPLLLSLAAAAETLSLSRRSIERLIAAGRLPSVRVGHRRLVRYADLARVARHGLAARAVPAARPEGAR